MPRPFGPRNDKIGTFRPAVQIRGKGRCGHTSVTLRVRALQYNGSASPPSSRAPRSDEASGNREQGTDPLGSGDHRSPRVPRSDEGTGNRPACRDKPCLSALAEQASFAGANDSNAGNLAPVRICLRQIVRPWRTGRARLVPTAALKRFGLRRDRRGRCPHRPSVQIRSSRGTRHQASDPPVGTSTCALHGYCLSACAKHIFLRRNNHETASFSGENASLHDARTSAARPYDMFADLSRFSALTNRRLSGTLKAGC